MKSIQLHVKTLRQATLHDAVIFYVLPPTEKTLVCVVCGVWCVVCGVCGVCGVWCVVCGVWCVVCGVWCGVCVCVCMCVCTYKNLSADFIKIFFVSRS